MTMHFTTFLLMIAAVLLTFTSFSQAIPNPASAQVLRYGSLRVRDEEPVFPDQPPSCPICAQNYSSISSCAQAAPVLANVSMIIFNPGAFIDVIKCACTDTFESVYPQCVDCFTQTNQTDVLNAPDLPSVVSGMRSICAIASTLLGGAASADGEVPTSSSSAVPTPTALSTSRSAKVLLPRAQSLKLFVVLCFLSSAVIL